MEESPRFSGGKIKYRLAVCYFLKGAFTPGVDIGFGGGDGMEAQLRFTAEP